MTEKRPLFRPEVVEHHARARTAGRTLDLAERRTTWLFRGLLAAVALAVALSFVVDAETTARGPAVVTGSGEVVVATDTRRVRPGQRVGLAVGGQETHGHVVAVRPGEAVVQPHATLPRDARGTARIRVGRDSVAALLLGWDE